VGLNEADITAAESIKTNGIGLVLDWLKNAATFFNASKDCKK